MFSFDKPDFTQVLSLLTEAVKGRLTEQRLVFENTCGRGFAWTNTLPSGISVFVADLTMMKEVTINRVASDEKYFCLQFTEQSLAEGANKRLADDLQSHVKLSHTFNDDTIYFPAGIQTRTVGFFFNNDHFASVLGRSIMDEMLRHHFPLLIQKDSLQPIATAYRVMLEELLVEKIVHPLKNNYVQNRVLLLLETFIAKLHKKHGAVGKKVKRSDDETIRLMKVEALLVKNFEKPPPTIDELSRISAMSPTKLKNDFKALYGLPIYEYYQKNRMIKAKSLLMLGKYSIKEVGIMVGYSNLSHFANTFKKEFGHLPSELSAKDGVLVYNN